MWPTLRLPLCTLWLRLNDDLSIHTVTCARRSFFRCPFLVWSFGRCTKESCIATSEPLTVKSTWHMRIMLLTCVLTVGVSRRNWSWSSWTLTHANKLGETNPKSDIISTSYFTDAVHLQVSSYLAYLKCSSQKMWHQVTSLWICSFINICFFILSDRSVTEDLRHSAAHDTRSCPTRRRITTHTTVLLKMLLRHARQLWLGKIDRESIPSSPPFIWNPFLS